MSKVIFRNSEVEISATKNGLKLETFFNDDFDFENYIYIVKETDKYNCNTIFTNQTADFFREDVELTSDSTDRKLDYSAGITILKKEAKVLYRGDVENDNSYFEITKSKKGLKVEVITTNKDSMFKDHIWYVKETEEFNKNTEFEKENADTFFDLVCIGEIESYMTIER